MSQRRKVGDQVYVARRDRTPILATIMTGDAPNLNMPWNDVDEEGHSLDYCPFNCGDPECREWPNLEAVNGQPLCHITECKML